MDLDLSALTNAEAKALADAMIRAVPKYGRTHLPTFDAGTLALYHELKDLRGETCLEVNMRVAFGIPGEWS